MPNRIIRESILDSARYLELTEGEQLLFIHLMLLADDFGCVSLAPAFLARRAFSERPGLGRMVRMLSALADQDLIRIYEVEGSRFAFIPRFGQRLRQMRLRHPIPPEATLEGDEEAKLRFIEFKSLPSNMTVNGRSYVSNLRPEVEVKRSKPKAVDRTTKDRAQPIGSFMNPKRTESKPVEKSSSERQEPDPNDPLILKAKAAGLEQRDGETRGQFALRVAQAAPEQPASKFQDLDP